MTRERLLWIRVALVIFPIVWALGGAVLTVLAQDSSDSGVAPKAPVEEAAKQERKKELDEMRRRAQSTAVFRVGARKSPAKLLAEPVLRYSGEFHGVQDATTWVFVDKGRPVAVEKIEWTRTPYLSGYYYCLASLCDGLIEVRWPGQASWAATRPGVDMRTLADAPRPAASDAARTRHPRRKPPPGAADASLPRSGEGVARRSDFRIHRQRYESGFRAAD